MSEMIGACQVRDASNRIRIGDLWCLLERGPLFMRVLCY